MKELQMKNDYKKQMINLINNKETRNNEISYFLGANITFSPSKCFNFERTVSIVASLRVGGVVLFGSDWMASSASMIISEKSMKIQNCPKRQLSENSG